MVKDRSELFGIGSVGENVDQAASGPLRGSSRGGDVQVPQRHHADGRLEVQQLERLGSDSHADPHRARLQLAVRDAVAIGPCRADCLRVRRRLRSPSQDGETRSPPMDRMAGSLLVGNLQTVLAATCLLDNHDDALVALSDGKEAGRTGGVSELAEHRPPTSEQLWGEASGQGCSRGAESNATRVGPRDQMVLLQRGHDAVGDRPMYVEMLGQGAHRHAVRG